MLSLADLRARNVTVTWQEAVAIVQELVQTLALVGAAERLPDLEHVALIPNGDVVALPGSPSVANPIRHLGLMLGQLLDRGTTPPELLAVVTRATATPPEYPNMEAFSKALEFFERPGRRGDIERLVSRAATAEAQSRADEELRKLKERASVAERDPLEETMVMRRPSRSRLPLAIAGALVVFGVVGVVWYQVDHMRKRRATEAAATTAAAPVPAESAAAAPPAAGGQHPAQAAGPAQSAAKTSTTTGPTEAVAPAGGQTAAAAQTPGTNGQAAATPAPAGDNRSFVSRWADAIRSAVGSVFRSSEPAQTAAASAEAPSVAEKPKARARSKAPARPAAAPLQPPVPQVSPIRSAAMIPAPSADLAGGLEDPAVYSSADAAVQPPIMTRPVLPAEPPPDLPLNQVGTLDLVIDTSGNVERVKLTSPANRYEERMLVSHAKSWKFKPAMRDGRPVKYRTRVRVTI